MKTKGWLDFDRSSIEFRSGVRAHRANRFSFLGRCNGYQLGLEHFSDETYAWAGVQLALCRIEISQLAVAGHIALRDYYLQWCRFDDDRAAMVRIEAACSEEDFRSNMHAWCMDALRDCASADAYYDEQIRCGMY